MVWLRLGLGLGLRGITSDEDALDDIQQCCGAQVHSIFEFHAAGEAVRPRSCVQMGIRITKRGLIATLRKQQLVPLLVLLLR